MDMFEIRRQAFHLALGATIILLAYFNYITYLDLAVLIILGLFVSVISKEVHIPIISWFLKRFERKDCSFQGEGLIYFLTGSFIVLALFPKQIALTSILILTIGDSTTTLVGTSLKRKRWKNNKSISATVIGILLSSLASTIFTSFSYAFAAASLALFFEFTDLKIGHKKINDNLYIPLISSIILLTIQLI